MLIVSLYMSGVTYRYYSPVRFVNESNPTRCLLLIPAAVCCLDVHHSHLERKTFFSVSPGDTSPLVSRYADISSVSPLSCFMISVLYRVKGLSHEKWTKKKKSLKRNTTCIFIHRLSSFIPGCLIHVALLSLPVILAPRLPHIRTLPGFYFIISLRPHRSSLRLAYSFFTCDCKSVKVILNQSNPL